MLRGPLALVPASRYNCDVKKTCVNVFAKFHLDLKMFRWGPLTSNLPKGFFMLENK